MFIPIWLFCIFMFISFCMGIAVHVYIIRKSFVLSNISNEIRANWFWIVFLIILIYVILNFEKCIDLHFTKDFNGNNLIFVLLIVFLLLPMFDSIKANNISIQLYNQNKNIKESEDTYKKAIENAEKKASHNKNSQGGRRR